MITKRFQCDYIQFLNCRFFPQFSDNHLDFNEIKFIEYFITAFYLKRRLSSLKSRLEI